MREKLKLLIFINDAREYQEAVTLHFDKEGISFTTTFAPGELPKLEQNIIREADDELYLNKYNAFVKNYTTANQNETIKFNRAVKEMISELKGINQYGKQ